MNELLCRQHQSQNQVKAQTCRMFVYRYMKNNTFRVEMWFTMICFSFERECTVILVAGIFILHRINDLIVVGEDQFYFTNYLYMDHNLEMFLGLHWGSIGYFDGKNTRLVQTELSGPNGIALSKDGKSVSLSRSHYYNLILICHLKQSTPDYFWLDL